MRENAKPKHDYTSVSGSILYVGNHLQDVSTRDSSKFRYLNISGYAYPFEIFIGKSAGDFKPKLEKIDELHAGDTITAWYYETNDTKDSGINRFIQFIDKDNKPYYTRGSSSGTIGMVVIGLCMLILIIALEAYRRKKFLFK